MIESDNNKLNNNKKKTVDLIIKEYSNDYNQFEKYLKHQEPQGKDLYQYMVLSRATFNDNDIIANQFYNTFNTYLNNRITIAETDEETLDFILEFYSKSLNKIDKLFSILFNTSDINKSQQYTVNQYFYIIDSIMIIQNKLITTESEVIRMKPLIYKFIDTILQYFKINSISLNIGNYNKILEVYSNFNDKESIVKTLDDLYLSFIKPDMNTYMLVFPFLDSNQSSTLMSKIKGNSNFKTGKNTYQLLNEQFEKLLQEENNK
ncbi:hypothetical protein DICPUDRAFT_84890 [Dictyostelium purpureum]|uniref:Uncharacterized protein n=1 Tax=Dictyostelium purpureum TaxID=5786 RepID=F1A418_DICPU|nr:uncharacterized protein DICPUDRAFT_84890 [Dictyostelium purpureum]EGC29061.1 hypothetical protein DICPUDRAFT_84890 [Dictyostelium purpureum]|eukprot:XP_003294410.1 hypothetical protein DICPUDRAFT_84890 [Dictyostelium purpureum]